MKKKILFILPRPPYPLKSGGDHAQFHFISEALKWMDVSVCFEVDENNHYGFKDLLEIWKDLTVYPFLNLKGKNGSLNSYRRGKELVKSIKRKLLDLIYPSVNTISDPVKYQSFINLPLFPANRGFINMVAEIVQKSDFDIIQVDFIALAPLVHILPEKAVKVLMHHEIRHIRIKREMDLFNNIDSFDLCRYNFIKDQEISILKKFDRIITLSETDKKILSADLDAQKIYVSPATIPLAGNNSGKFLPFKNRLTFIGSSGHLPNTDGIIWFIEKILPEVKAGIPDVKLEIIGNWEAKYIKKYGRSDIIFHGFVEDMDEILQGSLLIVPLRIGSGIRLKIIEAVNAGIPFITTSIGVEGLNFRNNEDCIISDNEREFAENISMISEKTDCQHQMVLNANSRMQLEFSIESILKRRMDFYYLNK